MLSAAQLPISMDVQTTLSDVQDDLHGLALTLENFKDTVGDEIRRALREEVGSVFTTEFFEQLKSAGLVSSNRAEAEYQMAELQREIASLRDDKLCADHDLLERICALSLAEQTSTPHSTQQTSIPHGFVCPITLDVMEDPVSVFESGIAYERMALEEALRHNPCLEPLTGKVYAKRLQYSPNVNLRQAISEWREGGGGLCRALAGGRTFALLLPALHLSLGRVRWEDNEARHGDALPLGGL